MKKVFLFFVPLVFVLTVQDCCGMKGKREEFQSEKTFSVDKVETSLEAYKLYEKSDNPGVIAWICLQLSRLDCDPNYSGDGVSENDKVKLFFECWFESWKSLGLNLLEEISYLLFRDLTDKLGSIYCHGIESKVWLFKGFLDNGLWFLKCKEDPRLLVGFLAVSWYEKLKSINLLWRQYSKEERQKQIISRFRGWYSRNAKEVEDWNNVLRKVLEKMKQDFSEQNSIKSSLNFLMGLIQERLETLDS